MSQKSADDPNIVVKQRFQKASNSSEAGHFDDPFFKDMFDFVAQFENFGGGTVSPEASAKRDQMNTDFQALRTKKNDDTQRALAAAVGRKNPTAALTNAANPTVATATTTTVDDNTRKAILGTDLDFLGL